MFFFFRILVGKPLTTINVAHGVVAAVTHPTACEDVGQSRGGDGAPLPAQPNDYLKVGDFFWEV